MPRALCSSRALFRSSRSGEIRVTIAIEPASANISATSLARRMLSCRSSLSNLPPTDAGVSAAGACGGFLLSSRGAGGG